MLHRIEYGYQMNARIMQENLVSDFDKLAISIKAWGRELGFADIAITDIDLTDAEAGLQEWLDAGFHGTMDYMAAHGMKRARPAELVPGTRRVISARMNYLPAATEADWREREERRQQDPAAATISVYARGRDYHKVLRSRLQQLAERIQKEVGEFGYRAFTDSAPVMEVALAEKSGLGWRGKHTLLLNRQAGSMFFLGEIYTDLPLPVDVPISGHCGQCSACIDICPTQAIIAPYTLDARRCISYLTIEFKGSIPLEFRAPIGNRILGCDDCQLACPWNKFAQRASLPDFDVRNGFDDVSLTTLFAWSEDDFNRNLEGSAIRRIGHERWLRNIAVALGNADTQPEVIASLRSRADHPSELVREHVEWALQRHGV
jgi:epoxyqueuosine reductase